MISALFARLGIRFSGALIFALAFALLMALAGLGAWKAASRLSDLIETARTEARQAEAARWTASIAEANAKAEHVRAAQAVAAAQAEAQANAEINALRQTVTQLEIENEKLPHGNDTGLDRDRVRLLPR